MARCMHAVRDFRHWPFACLCAVVVCCLLAHLLVGAPDPQAFKAQGPDTLGNPLPTIATPASVQGLTRTQLVAQSTTAASANNVTLTGSAGLTTYMTGFEVTGAGATSASVIAISTTGVAGAQLQYSLVIPAGATTSITPLIVEFTEPVASSAVAGNIVLQVPSFGVGNTNVAVTIHGFKQ